MKKLPFRFAFVFVILLIITIPFEHTYIPDMGKCVSPYFEYLVRLSGRYLFNIGHKYIFQIISDSTGMYLHVFNLFVLALLGGFIWGIIDKKLNSYQKLLAGFMIVIRYYLAIQLLDYGFNKVFKWQFYTPEPNTLFTTLGNTPHDLLYWSTMGISYSYTVFLGVIEVIAGILLLFRKTTLLGALLSIAVLVNVLLINFSYDISVKVYCSFLLLLSALIILPNLKSLFIFFFKSENNPGSSSLHYEYPKQFRILYLTCKTLVILFILFDGLSDYVKAKNFNDDLAPRPLFHGAYHVSSFIENHDTLPPLETDKYRWKRMFIHRRGYLIIQFMDESMRDYMFSADTIHKAFYYGTKNDTLLNHLNYEKVNDSTLRLSGCIKGDSIQINLKKIDLSKLPVFQTQFHWTIDQY